MGETPDIDWKELGVQLGKLALERGFITPEQLRDALAQQARDVEAGRARPRQLGNILLSKGYLNDRQLAEILDEQKPGTRPPAASPPPSAQELPPLGKYAILREIGRGGMGAVYEAIDTDLNRKVALRC